MDLLQSFMGCMYPGSIRTESIESIEQEHPAIRFEVSNIDERGNVVSQGQLHLTDKNLIYFRPSRFPTCWPIGYIRRYGCSEKGDIFSFEAGRRCPTGEAIYAFRLNRASDLVSHLKEKIENSALNEKSNDSDFNLDITSNCCANRLGSIYQSDKASPNYTNTTRQKVPQSTSVPSELSRHKNSDEPLISIIDRQSNCQADPTSHTGTAPGATVSGADPRPLSYALIDFGTTRALNESAQAHAASRVR